MSSTSIWLPLGTASIVAISALTGAMLGPVLTARHTRWQWQRDKRAQVCESYQVVLQQAFHFADEISAINCETDSEKRTQGLAEWDAGRGERIWEALRDADSIVRIYVSKDLRDKVGPATAMFQLIAHFAAQGNVNLGAGIQVFQSDVNQIEQLIRKELG